MRIQTRAVVAATAVLVAACAGGEDPNDTFIPFADEGIDSSVADDSECEGGDGDPTTSTTGDGDGDPTTSTSGDGDPTTSTSGDGDPTTTGDGDGDGDVPVADMIDDFEDGNNALLPNGGRQGYWYVYNDGAGTQTPPAVAVVPQNGGAAGTGKAMRTTGSGFSVWGAGIGVDLNNPGDGMGGNGTKMAWNAAGYTGLVVMAKGSGSLRVVVQTTATVPLAEGGSCAADCDLTARPSR